MDAWCPTYSRFSNVWETMGQLEAPRCDRSLRQFIPTHSNVRMSGASGNLEFILIRGVAVVNDNFLEEDDCPEIVP